MLSNELIVDGMFQLSGDIYRELDMLEHAAQNTEWLRKVLNTSKNRDRSNNYYPTPAYNIITNGDFISRVVNQMGSTYCWISLMRW